MRDFFEGLPYAKFCILLSFDWIVMGGMIFLGCHYLCPASLYPVCQVWMLCLSYPHVFIVGGEDWDGLQVGSQS